MNRLDPFSLPVDVYRLVNKVIVTLKQGPSKISLLNNSFSHDRSTALAKRVLGTGATTPADRIRFAWQFALGRKPTSHEEQLSGEHLVEQGQRFAEGDAASASELLSLASLCHVLINSNEFIYVD